MKQAPQLDYSSKLIRDSLKQFRNYDIIYIYTEATHNEIINAIKHEQIEYEEIRHDGWWEIRRK